MVRFRKAFCEKLHGFDEIILPILGQSIPTRWFKVTWIDSPNGGDLSPSKVIYGSKGGHDLKTSWMIHVPWIVWANDQNDQTANHILSAIDVRETFPKWAQYNLDLVNFPALPRIVNSEYIYDNGPCSFTIGFNPMTDPCMVGIFTYMITINQWPFMYTVNIPFIPWESVMGGKWFLKFTCTANGRKAWCSRGRCTSFTPGRLGNGDWPEAFPMTDSHGDDFIFTYMNGCHGTGIFTYMNGWFFYGKLVGKIYTMTMDGSYGIAWLCYIIFMVIQSSWECKGSIGEVFATGCGPYGHWLWCFQSFQSYAAQVMTGFLLKKKTPASCVGFFFGGDLHWNGRHKTRYDKWQHDELIRFYETFDVPNGECLFFLWLIWSIWLWVVDWNVFLCWPRSLGKWSNLTIIFFKWVEATNSDRMWLLWLPVVRIRSHVVHISTMTIAESMIDRQTGWWQLKYFLCSPYLGKIPILTNIFQMVWNHQRVKNWN